MQTTIAKTTKIAKLKAAKPGKDASKSMTKTERAAARVAKRPMKGRTKPDAAVDAPAAPVEAQPAPAAVLLAAEAQPAPAPTPAPGTDTGTAGLSSAEVYNLWKRADQNTWIIELRDLRYVLTRHEGSARSGTFSVELTGPRGSVTSARHSGSYRKAVREAEAAYNSLTD